LWYFDFPRIEAMHYPQLQSLLIAAAVAGVACDGVINYASGGSGWGVPGAPDYVSGATTCASGMMQSPINIDPNAASKAQLSPLNLTYEDSLSWAMLSTYNYLEVEEITTASSNATATSLAGNGITMDAYGFTMTGGSAAGLYVPLNQYHFHSPSENMLDGVNYALEMHMVHKLFSNPQGANGSLIVATVVSVMFKLDPADANNSFVDQLLSGPLSLNQSSGFLTSNASAKFEEDDAQDQFSFMKEVFKQTGVSKYYAFNGSLTTPPCTEGINWRVLATPLTISRLQLKAFKDALAVRQGGSSRGGDNRDVQGLNGRSILASFSTPVQVTASNAYAPKKIWLMLAATLAVFSSKFA
jgi:carbonic anhydrase